jgi:DNA polymerase-3 subunit beta
MMLDICRQLPDESQIVIEQIDNTVRLLSGRSRFKLNTLPVENFPAFSQIEAELSIELSASTLLRLFSKPLFSVAQQDVRTFLNGLLLEIEGQQIRTVGSDGHRLTLCEDQLAEAVSKDVSLLIPRKGVVEMCKLFKDHNTTVRLDISRSFIAVHCLNTSLSVKLIDDSYPIYHSVIPTEFSEHAEFNTKDFKDVIARVAVMTGDILSSVELNFEPNVLNIHSRSVDQQEAEDSIDIQLQGEPFTIGFKCSYLADLANNIDSDEMRMSFPADKSSLLTRNPDDALVKYILSPVRI